MKKISIIGLFCTGVEVADGQSIKTRIIAQEVEKVLGMENVRRIDTYGWKQHPLMLLRNCITAVHDSTNVVFLTDMGGIKVFPWLLSCINVFAKRTIHYVVVGGWLVHFVKKHRLLSFFLKRLDGIFVETQVMQKCMEAQNYKNVYVMPNFKNISPLKEDNLCYCTKEPYKFCVFSRVMKEKGIEDAINAVRCANSHYGRIVCALDIFGQVDPKQTEWFENLKLSFPDYIQYCGIVPYEKTVDALKGYHALLFPTRFYTEGIPGTIIDAYAAGVPVVASEWESFSDVIDHHITGIGYPFQKPECLTESVMTLVETPELAHEMKVHCLAKAKQYLPDAVVDTILSKLS